MTERTDTMTITDHPAVFHDRILTTIASDLAERATLTGTTAEARLHVGKARLLDPFAGTGKVGLLGKRTTCIEIEPEWAAQAMGYGAEVIVADSLDWMETTRRRFDVVVTSPCYGNRMADHHDAKDKCSECLGNCLIPIAGTRRTRTCPKCGGTGLSKRRSYRHDLGRMPTDGSAATLHYGDEYRAFHRRAWAGVWRVLEPGGLFYLNSKNFIRAHKVVDVNQFHRRACEALGFERLTTLTVMAPGMRFGKNGQRRIRSEVVYVFRKPEER